MAVIGMVLLLCPVAAHAKPAAAGNYSVLGMGVESCGTWKSAREEKEGWKALALGDWIGGYITAYNAWSAGPDDITKGTDLRGALAWMDDYCAKNPLETIATAASELVVTLLARGNWEPEEAATPSAR